MKTPIENALLGTRTIMKKFTPDMLPPSYRFHYHQGIFLTGAERTAELTGDNEIYNYIKEWIDFNVDSSGNVPNCYITEFDDIQPANLLFGLYDRTKDERYKIVIDTLFDAVEKWPTNAVGGVWHKYRCKNQMWLDTMYMFGVFAAKYAAAFDKPYMFDKIYTQAKLMHDNMTDKNTGLMYHMWDDSKAHPAVDKNTGLVPICWGRAMGWYAAALPEIIELMTDGEKRTELINIETELLNSIRKYQDKKTGLWYQLPALTDDKRNWHETSCTCLFTYAALRSRALGLIDDSFDDMIKMGYNGALSKTETNGEELFVSGVCVGTGVGSKEYYLTRPTSVNDLHGMGAFLLMCTEIAKSGIII